MRDQHTAPLRASNRACQPSEHGLRCVGIQIAGRLIGEDQRGPMHECPRKAIRCNSPPDNSRGMLMPRSPRPTAVSKSATRSARAGRATFNNTSGSSTFCATVRCGKI